MFNLNIKSRPLLCTLGKQCCLHACCRKRASLDTFKLYIFILLGYDLIGSMMLQCVRVPGQNQGQWTGTPPQCRPRRKLHESFITAVVTYMTRIVYRYLCNYVSVCLPHSLPCI